MEESRPRIGETTRPASVSELLGGELDVATLRRVTQSLFGYIDSMGRGQRPEGLDDDEIRRIYNAAEALLATKPQDKPPLQLRLAGEEYDGYQVIFDIASHLVKVAGVKIT